MSRVRVPAAGLSSFLFVTLLAPALTAAPPGGTPICRERGAQSSPAAVPDGGGILVAWLDARRGVLDLYAQHVLADGSVDPAWPAGGLPVTESGGAGGPGVFPDGSGGALVVWFDAGASTVFAQRVQANGTLAAGWPANGRALVTETLNGPSGRIFLWSADPSGHLYVAWNTFDSSTERLLLQHFDPSGDPVWASPVVAGVAGLGGAGSPRRSSMPRRTKRRSYGAASRTSASGPSRPHSPTSRSRTAPRATSPT